MMDGSCGNTDRDGLIERLSFLLLRRYEITAEAAARAAERALCEEASSATPDGRDRLRRILLAAYRIADPRLTQGGNT